MSEKNVPEYDHDVLILISLAQSLRNREKKAGSINPHADKTNRVGKIGLFAFSGEGIFKKREKGGFGLKV